METGEIVLPMFVLPRQKGLPAVLDYSPSLKCILTTTDPGVLTFLNIDSKSVVKSAHIGGDLYSSSKVALSPDSSVVAFSSMFDRSKSYNPDQLCICRMDDDGTDNRTHNMFLIPRFRFVFTRTIKFFPDGTKVFVASSGNKANKLSFGKLIKLGEECWVDKLDQGKDGANSNTSDPASFEPCRHIKKVEFTELNSSHMLGRNCPANTRRIFAVAVSPDVTRILAGSNDGDVIIIDVKRVKVLNFTPIYDYFTPTTACQYNPTYGHHEFATIHYDKSFRIWKVEDLDDGSDQVKTVHHLKINEINIGYVYGVLSYSPDGELIALTLKKTYIISSHSGEILYTLVYNEELGIQRTVGLISLNLFFGHVCQVSVLHQDNSLGFWKLPVVYSLKTLCLLLLKSVVKYKDIEELPLPPPAKRKLKYIYV